MEMRTVCRVPGLVEALRRFQGRCYGVWQGYVASQPDSSGPEGVAALEEKRESVPQVSGHLCGPWAWEPSMKSGLGHWGLEEWA